MLNDLYQSFRSYLAQPPGDEHLRNDRDFNLNQVKRNGKFLQHLSSKFRKDKEIVMEAIKQNPEAYRYTHVEHQQFLHKYIDLKNFVDNEINDYNENFLNYPREYANRGAIYAKHDLVTRILEQCEDLFLNGQLATNDLVDVLSKTKIILVHEGNFHARNAYNDTIEKISKNPSPKLQMLGQLMEALAYVVLGVGLMAIATTPGAGLLPTAKIAATSLGIFAAASYVDTKANPDNPNTAKLTEEMNELRDTVSP